MKTEFHKIDLATWSRGQMFYYFSKMAPTGYSLTVNLDVTILKKTLKDKNLKFFPTYLYLVTREINKQVEFKVAINDEILGYWDSLTPMYAAFHKDDKTFSLMWTEYNEDFSLFYQSYINNDNQYGHNHGVLSQPNLQPPKNCYTVSCLPWVDFEHFALHMYENKPYYFPTVESGKITEKDGKYIMPLALTLHHATTDGYHVKIFLEGLQHAMDNPQEWINPQV